MGYKIGVSSGIYSVARPEELSTTVRKLGYSLTRGTSVIELAADVPNEVTETEGEEIRKLARNQGVDILFHGSLTVPMAIPERGEWRDAHDHICKSIRSAVFSGAKYCNFHASLNIWLELMTYAGRKLTMSFCDHEGNFISKILSENEKLREWFIETKLGTYEADILTPDEIQRLEQKQMELQRDMEKKIENINTRMSPKIVEGQRVEPELSREEGEKQKNELREQYAKMIGDSARDFIRNKLKSGGKWNSEELRRVTGVLEGYHIMAHHMFYNKDPIWTSMAEMYKDVVERYKIDYSNDKWLDETWRKAEEKNDREFKEFFYSAVAAKYLEGHLKRAFEWIRDTLVKKELAGNPELVKIANDMMITIECPDARDPTHGGLHLLWRPRQIYSAIKTIRKTLRNEKIWMLMDYEHVATQGLDPIKDMEETIKLAPDFGSLTVSIHSNAPNPLQPHNPIELGDIRIYRLLWLLRKSGFGKDRDVYLIFERGGGQDPFKQSIDALRIMVEFLEKDCPPEELPPEFFGVKAGTAGNFKRQAQIIRDHAYEPLKDLLEMPEEEWTMLSQTAIRKGKRPEQWKKEEFR